MTTSNNEKQDEKDTTKQQIEVVIGIDIGSESTKIVLGPSWNCEIVRNSVGGHTTPTIVSFTATTRQMGPTANPKSKQSVTKLGRLLESELYGKKESEGDGTDPFQSFFPFQLSFDDTSATIVSIPGLEYPIRGGSSSSSSSSSSNTVSSLALVSMLLGNIHSSVVATVDRLKGTILSDGNNTPSSPSSFVFKYVLSVGPDLSLPSQEALMDAAFVAGMEHVQLVESGQAQFHTYQRKFPNQFTHDSMTTTTTTAADGDHDNAETTDDPMKRVVIVDMGETQTTVSVIGRPRLSKSEKTETVTNEDTIADAGDAGGDEEKVTTTKEEDTISPPTVLSSVRNPALGAASVDIHLWEHFQSTHPALSSIERTSKAGQRLLEGTKKLKHLLSQLPEGTVTVENVIPDQDMKLTMTRSQLEELCQPEGKALEQLIQKALHNANATSEDGGVEMTTTNTPTTIFAVEVAGGGCRIPWVKDVITKTLVVGNSENPKPAATSLSYSLDDTSSALGAALMGEATKTNTVPSLFLMDTSEPETIGTMTEERKKRRETLREAEMAMARMDADQKAKANLLNQIEARVLELRAAKDGKHGKLLSSANNDKSEELDKFLQQMDDWLFSDEAYDATKEQVAAKLEDFKSTTEQDLAKDYYIAVQKEREAQDAALELEAKLAKEAEENDPTNNGGNDNNDVDDHDNRRLPKKRRMEIVMKNKAEANELFGDGNYKFAAARYTKALSHCAKFVDLNPDDVKEVQALKVTLNLNLALSYSKLENWTQALRVCNEALELDSTNAKALYRRASIYYEQKKWDVANKDVKHALQLIAPKEDKALSKLQTRIEAQLKRQKQKEKKMAQKMFG